MAEFTVLALVNLNEPAELSGASYVADIGELDPRRVDVVVDFSTPESVVASAGWSAAALVIGTIGLGAGEQ